jgi:hypothetical protein
LLANEPGKPSTNLEGGDVSSILENLAGGESLPDLKQQHVRKHTKKHRYHHNVPALHD